jgi:ABC-type branched-subunit amino acid transport system ATPase component
VSLLQVRGLVKRFGGVPAVDGLDLDVAAGEILAVIGPNGAGKSTLLHVIAGLTAPSSVTGIVLDGADLAGRRPHRIRRLGIATVRQDPQPFASMTAFDNVVVAAMFAGSDRRGERDARRLAGEQLERVELASEAGSTVDRLTLHQRRRLELACALAGTPRLLLLDELMAGSNATELGALVATVRGIRDELGIAVIWVEHVMRAVTQLADRVVVMDAGRELAQGRPEQVMADERVAAAYLGQGADHRAAG